MTGTTWTNKRLDPVKRASVLRITVRPITIVSVEPIVIAITGWVARTVVGVIVTENLRGIKIDDSN